VRSHTQAALVRVVDLLLEEIDEEEKTTKRGLLQHEAGRRSGGGQKHLLQGFEGLAKLDSTPTLEGSFLRT
jgi:hypothetical protein